MRPTVDARLDALVANLAPNTTEEPQIEELRRLLRRTRISDVASQITPAELSIDRLSFSVEEERGEIEAPPVSYPVPYQAAGEERADEDPVYHVFRRDAPLLSPLLPASTPLWGRGAAIEQSLGPFHTSEGRPVWFDFYRVIRLVPLYLAGDPQPAVLFWARELQRRSGPLPIDELLSLFSKAYDLPAGSFWMRANLFAPAAPAGSYLGLKIGGGQIR